MKAYTYLIKHIPSGLVYYGVRSANKVDPEQDLWQKYFTSSNTVKQLIEDTGADSFKYEVRKEFDTLEQAAVWETKVLRRCKVLYSEKWMNQNVAGYIVPTTESKKKISDFHKGKPKSEEHKRKISEANKGQKKDPAMYSAEYRANMSKIKSGKGNAMYGKHHSDETKAKIAEKNRAAQLAKGDKHHMKNLVWTEERRQKMRDIRAKCKPRTPEQIEAIAAQLRGRKRDTKYCPHCKRDIAVGWYNRHGENCKKNL